MTKRICLRSLVVSDAARARKAVIGSGLASAAKMPA
jgi:hypothetical protein